jgi:hypothetical protein
MNSPYSRWVATAIVRDDTEQTGVVVTISARSRHRRVRTAPVVSKAGRRSGA